MNPKVSVILTSYNHEEFISDAIESVLGQTFQEYELIIWDDASTDRSWEIINSFQDTRIRAYVNHTNEVRGSLNKMISISRGRYIAVLHSDDLWEHNKLEMQVKTLETYSSIGAVFSNVLVINENGIPFPEQDNFIFNQPNRSRYEWLNHFFFQGNVLCHPSVLIRKNCYKECGFYRNGFVQLDDFDLWVRLCLVHEIFIIPERLVRFRALNDNKNISGNRADSRIRNKIEHLCVLDNFEGVENFNELIKIFPDAKKYYINGEGDVLFALGKIALSVKNDPLLQLFGLRLIFKAINDPDRKEVIKKLYDFGNKEYFILTGENDIFSIEVIRKISSDLIDTQKQLLVTKSKLEETTNLLEETKSKLENTTNLLDETKSKLENTTNLLDKTISELDKSNEQILYYIRSRSWRYTKVFRKIIKLIQHR